MQEKISKLLLYNYLAVVFFIVYVFAETNMASIYILGSLGGDSTTAAYSITFFGVGNAITLPLAKPLVRSFGIKNSLIGCLLVFLGFSSIACFAPTYPIFIVFRLLQGLSSGPIMILISLSISTLATQEQKDHYVRNIGIVFISASIIGATVGGTIAYLYHWQWIFYLDFIFLSILTLGIFLQVKKHANLPTFPPLNILGYSAYAIALFCLSSYFTLGQQLDWLRSPLLVTLLVIGFLAALYFVLHCSLKKDPILNLSLFKTAPIAFALFQVCFLFSAYFGMVLLLSLWLNFYVHYTISWISVVLGTMAVTSILVMFFVNLMKERNSIPTLLLALIFFGFSCYLTMKFDAEVNLGRIAVSRIIAGIGLALFLPPLFHMILDNAKEHEGIDSIVLFQVARTLSSGLGAAIYPILWQRRFYFYYERLAEPLTVFSHKLDAYFSRLQDYDLNPQTRVDGLNNALQRQSVSLALDDIFYLMTIILVILFFITLFFYFIHKYFLKPTRLFQ